MAQLAFVQSIAAGATFDPLQFWQYRYAPRAGTFSLMLQEVQVAALAAVTPFLRATITSGSDTLMEESPLQTISAATTGAVLPAPDKCVPITDAVDGGDVLKVSIRNTDVAARVVAGIVEFS